MASHCKIHYSSLPSLSELEISHNIIQIGLKYKESHDSNILQPFSFSVYHSLSYALSYCLQFTPSLVLSVSWHYFYHFSVSFAYILFLVIIFLFVFGTSYTVPTLGPTQRFIQWVPEAFRLGVKWQEQNLTAHLHAVPRSIKMELYFHPPPPHKSSRYSA
jgi:hypothetical protein